MGGADEVLELPGHLGSLLYDWVKATPVHVLLFFFVLLVLLGLLSASSHNHVSWPRETLSSNLSSAQLFVLLHLVAPKPRPSFPSEKTYVTSSSSGKQTSPRPLPCWYDRWLAEHRLAQEHVHAEQAFPTPDTNSIEPAELRLSVVLPAYNEEARIIPTLEEAVPYLDEHFGRSKTAKGAAVGVASSKRHMRNPPKQDLGGYEIIVVNDGSKDRTVDVVLDFAKEHGLHDVIRVVTLEKNRGKGGGVTHGLRHVRGEYALFADADGASRFSDVGKLIEACEEVVDGSHRGVAIGSRAHLVGSEAVVQVPSSHPSRTYTSNRAQSAALGPAQLPHALLPPRPHHPHAASHLAHPRHPVRLQALLARGAAAHRALHARRGLDLRHRDAHARRVGPGHHGARQRRQCYWHQPRHQGR